MSPLDGPTAALVRLAAGIAAGAPGAVSARCAEVVAADSARG
jgi:hypothetical protein